MAAVELKLNHIKGFRYRLHCCCQRRRMLAYAALLVTADIHILFRAVSRTVLALTYADEVLCRDRGFAIEAVRQYGFAFDDVDGGALAHASQDYRRT